MIWQADESEWLVYGLFVQTKAETLEKQDTRSQTHRHRWKLGKIQGASFLF